MHNYANGFEYAIDNKKTEVAIKFIQSFPVFNEDGYNPVGADNETVTELILPYSVAKDLAEKLNKSING